MILNPLRWFKHRFISHEWMYGGHVEEDMVQIGVWIRCEYPGCGEIDDVMYDYSCEDMDDVDYA